MLPIPWVGMEAVGKKMRLNLPNFLGNRAMCELESFPNKHIVCIYRPSGWIKVGNFPTKHFIVTTSNAIFSIFVLSIMKTRNLSCVLILAVWIASFNTIMFYGDSTLRNLIPFESIRSLANMNHFVAVLLPAGIRSQFPLPLLNYNLHSNRLESGFLGCYNLKSWMINISVQFNPVDRRLSPTNGLWGVYLLILSNFAIKY